MNIEDLKVNPLVLETQEKVIKQVADFKAVSSQLIKLLEPIYVEKSESFIIDFKDFFKINNFEIQVVGSKIVALNEKYQVVLEHNKEDLQYLNFSIPDKKVFRSLEIRPVKHLENRLYWKHHILDIKFNLFEVDNLEERIRQIDDLERISKISKLLEGNIEHYEKTIEEFADIPFVFGAYDDSPTYRTFAEFFAAL